MKRQAEISALQQRMKVRGGVLLQLKDQVQADKKLDYKVSLGYGYK